MNAIVPAEHALDGEVMLPSGQVTLVCSTVDEQALAAPIVAAHAELIHGMRTTVDKAVVVGRMLLEAKTRFRGGRGWLWWLEHYTPIKRRMAAHYMALAVASAQMDSRKWKRISNLGIAGAVAELRRRRRAEAGADRPPPAVAPPASRPRHPCTDSLVDSLIRNLRVYVEDYDDLSVGDIRVALDDVADLVRRGALSSGEAGR